MLLIVLTAASQNFVALSILTFFSLVHFSTLFTSDLFFNLPVFFFVSFFFFFSLLHLTFLLWTLPLSLDMFFYFGLLPFYVPFPHLSVGGVAFLPLLWVVLLH